MSTMSYVVSTSLLFMSLVYATSNSGPTLLPDHPSPVASTNLLEFLAVYGGSYSNKEQLTGEKKKTGQHHILMDINVLPVDIPAFSKDQRITALLLEKANGAVYRKEIFEFIEEENEIIRVKRFNLTGNSTHNNTPVKELDPKHLKTNPNCDVLFEKVQSGVYVISFPDCRLNREGQSHPVYIAILTCSSLIIYTPVQAVEAPTVLPYFLKKTDSFPLPEYLFKDKFSDDTYDFVNPC